MFFQSRRDTEGSREHDLFQIVFSGLPAGIKLLQLSGRRGGASSLAKATQKARSVPDILTQVRMSKH
jgi:hypothetical protein